MPCREAIEPRVCQAAWIRFVPFLGAGTKEQKGTSAEGGAGGGSRGGGDFWEEGEKQVWGEK